MVKKQHESDLKPLPLKNSFLLLILLLSGPLFLRAQQIAIPPGGIEFEENKNQYPDQVRYRATAGPGISLFMENNRFTYVAFDPAELERIHEASHKEGAVPAKQGVVHLHAFRVDFKGSDPDVTVSASGKKSFYRNYFLGNDESRWASGVGVYSAVTYTGLYPGIDLVAYNQKDNFKYDFRVAAGADPKLIRMEFEGTDGISLHNNRLHIQLSTGEIVEQEPYSYQLIGNSKRVVKCFYEIAADGKTVSFRFPSGYDPAYPLVIDPILVGATYSGAPSSCMTFGHCATYDVSGNIYTGGECFNPGYPTNAGSFQQNFGGGNVDIAVAKLNTNASSLLWATYLGGSGEEIPNSLVTSPSGELYVLGKTTSANYPVSAGCFDNSYNGGDDIVVTHLNAAGSSLIGSTYMGGSLDDGGAGWSWLPWGMNGHDGMRGEIIVDPSGNAWVASFTSSNNFPTTAGTYDNTLGGTWDACVFSLSPTMAALNWSTYLGGSADDGSYGLRVTSTGEIYATGVTTSGNFPAMPGAYQSAYAGGTSDGFLVHFNAAGNLLLASTFFGTSGNEICYFMDIDGSDDPYVYGVSTGNMPVTAGVYTNPGSGNFVTKFDPALSSLTFSTVFGNGAGFLEPEAFMIDSCENIYVSGFNSGSSYPVTANALFPTQASASGGNCYFIVLSKDALSLSFGSFYYGWHVDGGTSRFDPQGIIYQGICMGSGGAPTPAWAWKNNVNAPSWDMFVVKIDLQTAGVNAVATASPNDTICAGSSVNFVNTSNGFDYIWNFGDGSPLDTTTNPSHIYVNAGNYQVVLYAIDSSSCNVIDSVFLDIVVLPLPVINLGNDTTFCGPVSKTLNATTAGCTYLWSTGATTATLNVNAAGTYWVTVDNGACTATDTIQIFSYSQPDIGSDTSICQGQNLTLDAGNPGSQYLWSTGAITQTINVNASGIYWVDVTSGPCSFRDSITVTVVVVPQPDLGNDTAICPGATLTLSVTNATPSYLWSDGSTNMTMSVNMPGIYWVEASIGSCQASDTIVVSFLDSVNLGRDVSLCELSSGVELDAGNPGSQYLWSTGATTQTIHVEEAGVYYVDVINTANCALSDTITVSGDVGGGIVYMPNCFTPNGDSRNEYFCAVSSSVTEFHMQIFNRWGQLIFESSDMGNCWDGTYKGNIVQEDVYVVKIRYKTECNGGQEHIRISHVAVLPGAHR